MWKVGSCSLSETEVHSLYLSFGSKVHVSHRIGCRWIIVEAVFFILGFLLLKNIYLKIPVKKCLS